MTTYKGITNSVDLEQIKTELFGKSCICRRCQHWHDCTSYPDSEICKANLGKSNKKGLTQEEIKDTIGSLMDGTQISVELDKKRKKHRVNLRRN
jgi:hypothetical protein